MYGAGLFKDLLQHEMVITAFFNSSKFHIQFGYEWSYFFISQVFQYQFIGLNNCQFVVININYFLGIFQHRAGVTAQEMFTFSHANHQWTAFPGCNDRFGVIFINQ